MRWYVSGDTHGDFTRFRNMEEYKNTDQKVGMIVLGDCAVNWTLDPSRDQGLKRQLKYKFPNFEWFLLRGNHDAHPEDVPTMEKVWNDDVCGYVWQEPQYPNIHYFVDGGEYTIDKHSVLTIGGAYSVDKFYRLMRGGIWHANEQLTQEEMDAISKQVINKTYDIVLTHTCPRSWQPTDLFLEGLDQSTVDDTMERWLDYLFYGFHWNIWLFGHYHADRIELPHVEMFYKAIEPLEHIWNRWNGGGIPWHMPKSPKYKRIMGED